MNTGKCGFDFCCCSRSNLTRRLEIASAIVDHMISASELTMLVARKNRTCNGFLEVQLLERYKSLKQGAENAYILLRIPIL